MCIRDSRSLIDFIFDEDMFKDAMQSLDIDVQKLPLGALTKTQIQKGYDKLAELEDAIKHNRGQSTYAHLTSQFFTQIPHNFGRARPPVLSTLDEVAKKFDMLNVLSDIETAQGLQDDGGWCGLVGLLCSLSRQAPPDALTFLQL